MNRTVVTIVVTYNAMSWIDSCLGSLRDSTLPTDVIVVDNQSSDGTVRHIVESYPWVELIDSNVNLGFGKANNLAIKSAWSRGYDWFFLLNQDAWLIHTRGLEILIQQMKSNPDYGLLSPVHLEKNKEKLDKHFQQYIEKSDAGFAEKWTKKEQFRDVIDVPFVNAAAWLISRACLQKVGVFHPLFDHYGEDINYTKRVRFENYKIGVVPEVELIHDRTYSNRKSAVVDQKKKFKRRMLNYLLDPENDSSWIKSRLAAVDVYFKCISWKRPVNGFQFMAEANKIMKELKTDLRLLNTKEWQLEDIHKEN